MKLLSTAILLIAASGCSSAADVNALPSTNPGCTHQVYKHSADGWVLTSPVVRFAFWGDYWAGPTGAVDMASDLVRWNFLLNTGGALDRLQEYGVVGSSMVDVPAVSTPQLLKQGPIIDDALIAGELNTEVAEGLLPVPDDQSLTVVMLPPGVLTHKLVSNKWTAYHALAAYGTQRYAFAVVSHQDVYGTDALVSHEIAEAATDPDLVTGYYSDVGGEVGDLCQDWVDYIAGYDVEKVWSEQACQCR